MKVKVKSLSRVQLFETLWTVARQAPPSMGFSRQEYWSGLRFPSPGDLPNPQIKPRSPTLQADSLPSEPSGTMGTVTSYYLISDAIIFPKSSHFDTIYYMFSIINTTLINSIMKIYCNVKTKKRTETWECNVQLFRTYNTFRIFKSHSILKPLV